ncbi:hypothetical protein [Streptomyces sp. NPDC058092]|uniref:hypothetical protein n=1 Tax=Streptomyces sp. NPDC058092 TaxID=3346336 RepID=UPI0036F00900
MTATTTEALARPGGRTESGARSATCSLARTEAVRLLRHPAVLVAFALYAAQWAYSAYSGNESYPVLQDEDRYTQLPLLLIAAGALLAANLAALRPHRHGTDAMFDLLVLAPWWRTCAQLLSLLPLAALSAAVAGARIGYAAAQDAAVGRPSGAELATGPLVVLLAGAIGVLAARLVRSVAAGPLMVAGLGVATVVGALQAQSDWRWWGLVAVEDENQAPLPSALMYRPAGWHLLYLAALLALVAAVALLRSGRHVTTGFGAVTGLALALAVVAGCVQLRGVPDEVSRARAAAEQAPSAQQVCGTRGSVDYCAFPEFAVRSRQWARVAEGVLRWVPQEAREKRYVVRQHIVPATPAPLPLESWAADDRAAGLPAGRHRLGHAQRRGGRPDARLRRKPRPPVGDPGVLTRPRTRRGLPVPGSAHALARRPVDRRYPGRLRLPDQAVLRRHHAQRLRRGHRTRLQPARTGPRGRAVETERHRNRCQGEAVLGRAHRT